MILFRLAADVTAKLSGEYFGLQERPGLKLCIFYRWISFTDKQKTDLFSFCRNNNTGICWGTSCLYLLLTCSFIRNMSPWVTADYLIMWGEDGGLEGQGQSCPTPISSLSEINKHYPVKITTYQSGNHPPSSSHSSILFHTPLSGKNVLTQSTQ